MELPGKEIEALKEAGRKHEIPEKLKRLKPNNIDDYFHLPD
jgi:hypothetical protein